MRGNIAQLMQQAQRMQENMQRAQEELAKLEVTGNAGGGMVSVTITGRMECRKVRIDPSVLSDPEMVEDLIAAAFNDAVNKVERRIAGEDVGRHRRHAGSARHEDAVLIHRGSESSTVGSVVHDAPNGSLGPTRKHSHA